MLPSANLTDGFVLADKSTIWFPKPLRNAKAKRLLTSQKSRTSYVSEPSVCTRHGIHTISALLPRILLFFWYTST